MTRFRPWWPCACAWRHSRREPPNPSWQASWTGSGRQAGAAVERLRRLLFEIQPPELERNGVGVALTVALEQASTEDGLNCELADRTTRQPTHAVRTLLYRVGREALANIRNHAQASNVEVHLDDDSNGVSLKVLDDGKGFDAEQGLRVRPGHLGLASMRERVEMTGGRLKLESQPGTGTALQVWLPDYQHTDSSAAPVTERTRVLIADDHPMFRDALVEAVKSRPDLELVGTAEDGRVAIDEIRRLRPEVALVDMRMPELDGSDVLNAVVRDGIPTRVLFLSTHTDSGMVYDLLARGAAGYLDKTASAEEVCNAIAAASRGKTILSDSIEGDVLQQIRIRGANGKPTSRSASRRCSGWWPTVSPLPISLRSCT